MSPVLEIWKQARKKPVLVQYREVRGGNEGDKELIKTREGTLVAVRGRDVVIKGVEGEIYPITKTTFQKTYEQIDQPVHGTGCPPDFDSYTNCNEKCPLWKCW